MLHEPGDVCWPLAVGGLGVDLGVKIAHRRRQRSRTLGIEQIDQHGGQP